MTPIFCSYELSKLAAERGFDWPCAGYYRKEYPDDDPKPAVDSFPEGGGSFWDYESSSPKYPGACTPQQLVDWLWEEHEIQVYAQFQPGVSKVPYFVEVQAYMANMIRLYDTLPEALRAALELVPVSQQQPNKP